MSETINRIREGTGEPFSFYQDGYLYKLLMWFRTAMHKKNTSAVIVIDGRSGMGKTTFANQVAVTIDENYGLTKIFYNPDDFITGLSVAKKGDCLVFDEAMLISNRSTLSIINRMVVQAMSMIRSKKVCIIFCVNSVFDLDKNLAISRADLLLHVFGDSLIDRGKFGAFFKPKGHQNRITQLYILGKKFYDYSRPKANFVGRFSKEFVVDEDKYELQKQKGVNEFLNKKVGNKTIKAYATRNNLIRSLREAGWSWDKLVEQTGLSEKTIREICDNKQNIEENKV